MSEPFLKKPDDRTALLKDAEYFADELTKRCEALAKIEPTGKLVPTWQQAAKVTRQVRGICRAQKDRQRQRAKLTKFRTT